MGLGVALHWIEYDALHYIAIHCIGIGVAWHWIGYKALHDIAILHWHWRYITLQYILLITLHHTALQHIAEYSTLHYIQHIASALALHDITSHYIAVHYFTLRLSRIQHITLQYNTLHRHWHWHYILSHNTKVVVWCHVM